MDVEVVVVGESDHAKFAGEVQRVLNLEGCWRVDSSNCSVTGFEGHDQEYYQAILVNSR